MLLDGHVKNIGTPRISHCRLLNPWLQWSYMSDLPCLLLYSIHSSDCEWWSVVVTYGFYKSVDNSGGLEASWSDEPLSFIEHGLMADISDTVCGSDWQWQCASVEQSVAWRRSHDNRVATQRPQSDVVSSSTSAAGKDTEFHIAITAVSIHAFTHQSS